MLFPYQVIRGSGSVKVVQNNLAGSLQLDDFTMQLKWSQIGKLHMYLIQVHADIKSYPQFTVLYYCASFLVISREVS